MNKFSDGRDYGNVISNVISSLIHSFFENQFPVVTKSDADTATSITQKKALSNKIS